MFRKNTLPVAFCVPKDSQNIPAISQEIHCNLQIYPQWLMLQGKRGFKWYFLLCLLDFWVIMRSFALLKVLMSFIVFLFFWKIAAENSALIHPDESFKGIQFTMFQERDILKICAVLSYKTSSVIPQLLYLKKIIFTIFVDYF